MMKTISPTEAARLVRDGATLVDIRGKDEHLRERIADAVHCPLEAIAEADLGGGTLVFHCRSGNRTAVHAEKLRAKGKADGVYVVEGGIDAWRAAGLPTVKDAGQPIELNRQVQIGAGGLALAGTLLGLAVSPWFFGIPAFVGAGLLFAGTTGFCGMARLLILAPWNRALRAA
jgi:rhodanese-related sulfurtransferase